MYAAVKFGWVSSKNLAFTSKALDIETLNEEALKGTYEATAISFALYPKICDEFALLRCAVSFGNRYGPKLIKLKDKQLKRNFKGRTLWQKHDKRPTLSHSLPRGKDRL